MRLPLASPLLGPGVGTFVSLSVVCLISVP